MNEQLGQSMVLEEEELDSLDWGIYNGSQARELSVQHGKSVAPETCERKSVREVEELKLAPKL